VARGAWGLVPKGKVTAGGFEGRAYGVVGVQRGRTIYDVHGEARVFRTKRHAYLALALSTEQGRPEVERFLDAFAPGESPAGERIAEDERVPRYVPPKRAAGADVGAGERLKLVRRERAPGEPHTMQEVERKALIVYKPEPPYTEEARKNNVTGVVRLRVVLNSTGHVTDAEVLKPLSDGLTESALRVARHMRFFPAVKDGRPVSQYVMLEYNFNIY
jgi:TonB family protein